MKTDVKKVDLKELLPWSRQGLLSACLVQLLVVLVAWQLVEHASPAYAGNILVALTILTCFCYTFWFVTCGGYYFVRLNVIGHTVWCYHRDGQFEMSLEPPVVLRKVWADHKRDNPRSPHLNFTPYEYPQYYVPACEGHVVELAIGGTWWRESRIGNFPKDGRLKELVYAVKFAGLSAYDKPRVRLIDKEDGQIVTSALEILGWVERHQEGIRWGIGTSLIEGRVADTLLVGASRATRDLLELVDKQVADRKAASSPHAQGMRLEVERALNRLAGLLAQVNKEPRFVPRHVLENLIDRRRVQQESCVEFGIAHIDASGKEVPADATKARRKAATIKAAAQTTK